MSGWLSRSDDDAINLLKQDHDRVEELFKQFEKDDNPSVRRQAAMDALRELKVHSAIEEEIFYPTVRAQVGDKLMNEAGEEHHVVKLLIAELESMGLQDRTFEAKFHALAENVRQHVKEEESEMLPKARKADIDFDALGRRMLERKNQLLASGFPVSSEEKLIRGGTVQARGGTIASPPSPPR